MKKLVISFPFLFLLILPGCMKKESYSNIPQIEFQGYMNVFDTSTYASRGILVFSFTDGDGDIGLDAGDTLPPYNKEGDHYYNLVINYYEKQMGVFHPIILDPPFSGRIPVLAPLNPGKAIKGVITDTLELNPKPIYDTIRFEVFIYDRALNKSNVITTPEIITKRH